MLVLTFSTTTVFSKRDYANIILSNKNKDLSRS